MKFGLGVMCYFKDGAPEPEGTVIFDTWPEIGDEVVLSDNKIWIITSVSEYGCWPVHVKRK